MNFDQAFEKLIGNEGDYSNDMRDPGNWTTGRPGYPGVLKGTKYGISAAAYPDLDIKNLTLEHAKAIYKRDYWDACEMDKLPDAIRFDLFDTAVNAGVKPAQKILQAALSVKTDGVIGTVTLQAAVLADPQCLDKRFNAHRLLYLCNLKTFADFGKGWVRRVANNMLVD